MSAPLSIGIIGGAGPMASALFHRLVVRNLQDHHHCKANTDFPKIVHISYPFENHSPSGGDRDRVSDQLKECIDTMRHLAIPLIAIACNSLHAYLTPPMLEGISLVHILKVTQQEVEGVRAGKVLVFCTASSRAKKLYDSWIPGVVYPSEEDQGLVDHAIDEIIAGRIDERSGDIFRNCIAQFATDESGSLAVILGCTEISELHDRQPIVHPSAHVIDPMVLVASKICSLSVSRIIPFIKNNF